MYNKHLLEKKNFIRVSCKRLRREAPVFKNQMSKSVIYEDRSREMSEGQKRRRIEMPDETADSSTHEVDDFNNLQLAIAQSIESDKDKRAQRDSGLTDLEWFRF